MQAIKNDYTALIYYKHVKSKVVSSKIEINSSLALLLKCSMRNKIFYSKSVKRTNRSDTLQATEVNEISDFHKNLSKGDREKLALIIENTLLKTRINESNLRHVNSLYQQSKYTDFKLIGTKKPQEQPLHLHINPALKTKDIVKTKIF